jgi:PAS domain S-box-containing protein
MFKKFSIRIKITALIMAVVLLTVLVTHYLAYDMNRNAVEEKYQDNLSLLAKNKALEISLLLNNLSSNLQYISQSELLKTDATAEAPMMDFFIVSDEESEEEEEFSFPDEEFSEESESEEAGMFDFMEEPATSGPDIGEVLTKLKEGFDLEEVHLTQSNGLVIKSTKASLNNQNFPDPAHIITSASSGIFFSEVYGNTFYAAVPVTTGADKKLLIYEVNAQVLNNILSDTLGLGETGEIVVASRDQKTKRISLINKLRHKPEDSVEVITANNRQNSAALAVLNGESGATFDIDYRQENVLTAYTPVPNTNWGVIAKIDTDEVYGGIQSSIKSYIVSGSIILLATLGLCFVFAGRVTAPLNSLKAHIEMLGQGILPAKVERQSNDEFGEMADSVDNLAQSLKKTAHFAEEIGEGDFDAEFMPMSPQDSLGNALLTMRVNLVEAEKRDKERNWIVTGVAEIGEILRSSDNLEKLGDEVLKYIIDKIDAVQGAFYVVNESQSEDPRLEITSSFAYSRKKYLKGSYKFAEGLVGQAAAEKDSILRTEVPENYVSITSGILGDQKPACILIVPLVAEEKVYGALEFAGFEKFNAGKVRFVEELSVIMARTVFNIKVNERTRKLLAESQAMSGELQEKQEILRQNAEEMQATQEELQRSNSRLEEQIEEVNRTQKRMQLLLENASEVITIYEKDGTIKYISPSVEPILGYSQNELIGADDLEKIHPEGREPFRKMLNNLLEKPDEHVTLQYEYRTKEGEYIWMEATGNNLMDNPAISGLVVNSQNITERKRAEQEQRMRSKMQALSENSPDLITRLEHGAISYINPVIEEFTGKKPSDYLNQPVDATDLNASVLEQWLRIVEDVKSTDDKVTTEMDFPSEKGDRIMQVNAIPEYDENDAFESVLVVSHDITERKRIELDIHNKNKKIADSINYAKRIQNAILPDNTVIRKALPDSFILYKPKDVVSGDFPWYVQVGETIYIAAVDCTGHGVPGALLSLIGYFLLNDIVRSRKISDPGKILDILDDGVTTTLRQDQDDSRTKDGMDIALCKIDMKKREVEFAGAHRPLYVMRKGEMEEIKGNKFAIGGGIYKNQTNFGNSVLSLNKGDSIFFCSDGFPDQFGGPQNRKFGPKRLRDLISSVHSKPMQEQHEIFDKEWEEWRGEEKQTDDVLLIGIKF